MSPFTSSVAFLLLVVLAAPLMPGIAARTRALLTGRRGAPVWQLYADLWRLAHRGAVYGTNTTWLFRFAPVAVITTVLAAAALLPFDGHRAVLSFTGDAVAFAYVLALGRFALVLGALDTGSSFEGMGASREVTFSTLVEFGLLLTFVALGIATGEMSLGGILGDSMTAHWRHATPALMLLAAGLFGLLLAECARVPVDDPTTHLELTMVHEVMVLDHGGPDLALIEYASALKFALFASIVAAVAMPRSSLAPLASAAALLGGLFASAIAVGLVESSMARLRLLKVPLFLAGSVTLGGFGLILLLQ
jgi:formate hydrogenlyase subunit 4